MSLLDQEELPPPPSMETQVKQASTIDEEEEIVEEIEELEEQEIEPICSRFKYEILAGISVMVVGIYIKVLLF